MKKYRYLSFVILVNIFILVSCNTITTPEVATFVTVNQLKGTAGFEWFDAEYNAYQPDPVILSQIAAKLQNDSCNFLIFVNPSCACTGTQKQFPATIKVLKSLGIDEPRFKVWAMVSEGDSHPYTKKFNIRKLPTFMIMDDSTARFSVIDTLISKQLLDPNPAVPYTIEGMLLKGIK